MLYVTSLKCLLFGDIAVINDDYIVAVVVCKFSQGSVYEIH